MRGNDVNLSDILGAFPNEKDNTAQVKAEPAQTANIEQEVIPEASPMLDVKPSRPPDNWLEDGNGNKIPTWNTDEDVKPKWKSKIFITSLVKFLLSVITIFFGLDLSPEIQAQVIGGVLAIIAGGDVMTVIFRFFFTKKKLV